MIGQGLRFNRQRAVDYTSLVALVLLWMAVVLVGPSLLGKVAGWVLAYLVFTNGFKMLAWAGMGVLWLIGGLLAVALLGAVRIGLGGLVGG
jgi:hypothetical protein